MNLVYKNLASSSTPVPPSCANCAVGQTAFCGLIDDKKIAGLEVRKKLRWFGAGEVIKPAGIEMPYVASVISGVACLSETMEDGRNQIIGVLTPSKFFGYRGDSAWSSTVTALSDLTLCCFDRRGFDDVVAREPRILQQMLEITLKNLEDSRNWLVMLGQLSAYERVASLIATYARFDASSKGEEVAGPKMIHLALTRTQIADVLGLTMETVSRQFSRLSKEGFLRHVHGRNMVIPDVAALTSLAAGEISAT